MTAPCDNASRREPETCSQAESASYIKELEAHIDAFGKVTPQQYEKELAALRSQVEEMRSALEHILLATETGDEMAAVDMARTALAASSTEQT